MLRLALRLIGFSGKCSRSVKSLWSNSLDREIDVIPRAAVAKRSSRRLKVEELESRIQPSGVPTPDHVVIVVEENHAFSEIIGSSQAPYINALAGQGALM